MGRHSGTVTVVAQSLAQWLALQLLLGCCSHSCVGAGTTVQAPVWGPGLLAAFNALEKGHCSFAQDTRLWLVNESLLKSRFCDFSQLI